MKLLKKFAFQKFLIIIILLLGGFLRFYQVSQVPVSLYWDEVASTYNAYSILETGKDEYGTPHPLLFRSFQDYKTPANIYLTAIAVKLFGLNEFSARFTSAFLGTLTILSAFFLVLEMLRNRIKDFDPEKVAILSAFLLSISPWHIQFSRTGFEANVGLFFVVTACALIFKFINSRTWKYFYFSMTVFAISIYFYRSIWVFTPLILFSIFLVYRKIFISHLKESIIGTVIFVLILSPFLPTALSKQGFTRQSQVNVFTNSSEQVYKAAVNQLKTGNTTASKIVFNRRIVYVEEIIKGYLAHFGPGFLFFQGDGNPRHGVLDMGLMYLWEFPFLIFGFIYIFKMKSEIKKIIFSWILIAPIPAALSVPAPHALRSLNAIPMPQLFVAIGIFAVFYYLKERYRNIFICLIILIIAIFFARYEYLYFIKTPPYAASAWADGYKELAQYVFANDKNYDKVLISGHFWQPYIYLLFYKNYPPARYQASGSKKGFDKYIFGGTSWDMNGKELGDQNLEKLAGTKDVLIALSPIEYKLQMNNLNKITEIKNHNNELVFFIATLK